MRYFLYLTMLFLSFPLSSHAEHSSRDENSRAFAPAKVVCQCNCKAKVPVELQQDKAKVFSNLCAKRFEVNPKVSYLGANLLIEGCEDENWDFFIRPNEKCNSYEKLPCEGYRVTKIQKEGFAYVRLLKVGKVSGKTGSCKIKTTTEF